MTLESSAREALFELAENRTAEEYITLIWAARYPSPSPPASTGWPYQASAGLVPQLSKIRKIK